MFRRLVRSLTVLAVLIAAYQAYVRLAVPRMEPPLAVREARRATRAELDRAAQAITKYQLLLSNYFPKDHWSQLRPPKVIASSNEQAMLVLDDYERHDDGLVVIERFALLVFPTPPREGIMPPRDAIILESAQGARLQFDDFRPERGQIGQITRGEFPGRITIRSDMHEPGPDDDLLVETADLEMNTKLLYTMNPVRFRMGQNIGGGRELEIRFLTDEQAKPNDPGLKIAGIDALEIRRDVRMRLQLETDSLLPGRPPVAESLRDSDSHLGKTPPQNPQAARATEKPPVEVTCSGPFTFDFVRYVASLDRDVNLRQLHTDGPSDQLVCNQLDLQFAPQAAAPGEPELSADSGERQQRELGRLEPAAIIAEGHPVVVNSPARGAQARGDRIQILLRDQRVRIAGSNAMLVYGPNVLRAPAIEYQHPQQTAATAIGRFRAAGPGSLQYVLDPEKPHEFFQALWQSSIELGREKGQPVLTLDGRPQLALVNAGSLTADRMKVYLRELEGNSHPVGLPIRSTSGSELQVVPDRLAASGRVEIHSPQLTGRSGELLATFRIQPPAPIDEANPAAAALPFGQSSPAAARQDAFHIESDRMQMELHVQGQTAQPASLACDGKVVFREVPQAAANDQPLEIRGALLTVDRLESGAPYIRLRGSRPDSADGAPGAIGSAGAAQPAQLSGRGITVLADVVELDSRANRLWSDRPGKATLLITRDLQGQAAATPFPVEITWHGGLEFDGRTIRFERDVLVAGTNDTLRCDTLAAKLTAPIQFGQQVNQQMVDLSEIDCLGSITINHLSRDTAGTTSHERMELRRLTINQQTGAVSGEGPGVIRSTRIGESLAALGSQSESVGQAAAPPRPAGSKLQFLRVDFHAGLAGNIYTRELAFYERIRTVYGPVDSWEQELDATKPESLPPDALTLSCDEMRINEDPLAARTAANVGSLDKRPVGPVQLQARGNVRIEGRSPEQGAFTAQADRASYEQAKDRFILEGNGRTPATLWRAGQAGAPPAARKIIYARSTGHVTVDGIQYFEFTPEDVESARRASPVR
jgi:lipopolysaccharide export system protein LptA